MHFRKELGLAVVVEQLIRSYDAVVFVVGHVGEVIVWGIKRVVQCTLGAEQLFIHFGPRNWFLNVDWHLESIPDVLAGGQAPKEAAVLGCSISWISRVDDHAFDIANRLVHFVVGSTIGEAIIHARVHSLLVSEKSIERLRPLG